MAETEREPATSTADLYHRHGEPDSSKWDEQSVVTDRPNDTEGEVQNTTFADRKAVQSAENKSVQSAETRSLEDMTKTELLELAKDRDVAGRSQMSKDELVDALGG